MKKKLTFVLSMLMIISLMGCNNETKPVSSNNVDKIENDGSNKIENGGVTVYIQDLSKKFGTNIEKMKETKNEIEFETNIIRYGYMLVSYSLVDYNDDIISKLEKQINDAKIVYENTDEYYDVDTVQCSNIETLNNDFGIMNYRYAKVNLKNSDKVTYTYVAWQQIDNQLLVINNGGVIPADYLNEAIEYLFVSPEKLDDSVYKYQKPIEKEEEEKSENEHNHKHIHEDVNSSDADGNDTTDNNTSDNAS